LPVTHLAGLDAGWHRRLDFRCICRIDLWRVLRADLIGLPIRGRLIWLTAGYNLTWGRLGTVLGLLRARYGGLFHVIFLHACLSVTQQHACHSETPGGTAVWQVTGACGCIAFTWAGKLFPILHPGSAPVARQVSGFPPLSSAWHGG